MVLGAVVIAVMALAAAPAFAIVGGKESPAPYSFMGSLQRLDSPRDDLHVCGVSLIAPTWGLTAGHCTRTGADVIDVPTSGTPENWQVRFGSTRVDSGGQLVDVERFVQLNNRYFDRDLALLRFAEPVQGEPIAIADTSPAVGTPARIMGWGQTCADITDPACLPQQLQEGDTQIQPAETCLPVVATDLCIGALDGSLGPENMDSGGPAIVMDDGRWTLVGAVEGGSGTGAPGPGLFTNVTQYRDWIDAHVSGRTEIPADTPFPVDSLAATVRVSGCAGALIESASSRPTDPAMVLTNGHCVENRPEPGSAVLDQPQRGAALIGGANGEPVVRAYTTTLTYATMTGTDVAVFQLDRTYEELAASGVQALPLATSGPQPGQRVEVRSALNREAHPCTVEAIVPELREAGYTQQDAIRYVGEPGCTRDTDPLNGGPVDGPGAGDSGSPLVDPDTGEVVGIHNTGNNEGQQCTEDNPCEVDADGAVTSVVGRNYGQQTAMLNSCLAPGSVLDLSRPGCTLTGPGTTS